MSKAGSLIINILFQFKKTVLQIKRLVHDYLLNFIPLHSFNTQLKNLHLLSQSISSLWTEIQDSEWKLQRGKVQNLRVVIRALNGLEIPAGSIFSFWKQVGYPGFYKGFVTGRELRQG